MCVSKLKPIGSDHGLSPDRRQAIIWINAGILWVGPLGTNFSDIVIEILTFSSTKIRLKVSPAKWRPFCLGLNVLSGYSSILGIIRFANCLAPLWKISWVVLVEWTLDKKLSYHTFASENNHPHTPHADYSNIWWLTTLPQHSAQIHGIF